MKSKKIRKFLIPLPPCRDPISPTLVKGDFFHFLAMDKSIKVNAITCLIIRSKQ